LISIAPRQGSLKHLVDGYKFHSEVASAQVLAELIDLRLGDLPAETVIVPIPTVASHIRERGFDHMLLMAKQLARRRQLTVADRILMRTDNLSQHQLSALDRRRLISKSLVLSPAYDQPVNDDIPRSVLLLDDIWTTGSTMIRAAGLLKSAGVRHIIAVAILTQPR
jgi:Predicted amidophosphoribosyltransferases